tara:strand:+ start:121 stop:756 length:636 start_codon:yes stop_codon:yes gene_type:complete
MEERKKCNRCKVNLLLTKFNKKRDDTYCKICIECNEKNRIKRQKNKCEHNRQKCRCKECKGFSICEHNKQKHRCKECKGITICEHNKIKQRCIECNGISLCEHKKRKLECKECLNFKKCLKFIKQNIIRCSRRSDKKYNRYDANNFIDMCFLNGLFEDYKKCYHCNIEFTYKNRCKSFVTIERLNNSIGHIKSNCVLACFECNCKKITNNI